jgi:hypothetical protein
MRPAPPAYGGKPQAATLQRAEATFAPQARVQRPPPPSQAIAEELVPRPGGGFHVRSTQRQTLSPPSGTFNFVRVHGETPRARTVLISPKLAHAQLAGGRPVVYAGTARFEQGEMAWWSNYSGTYQPIAAFRAQAGLPEDKFVPWQKLQMGGTAMQRGMFGERRAATPQREPDPPGKVPTLGPVPPRPATPAARPAATTRKATGPAGGGRPAAPSGAGNSTGSASAARPAGPAGAARSAGPPGAGKPAGPVGAGKPAGPSSGGKPAGPAGQSSRGTVGSGGSKR